VTPLPHMSLLAQSTEVLDLSSPRLWSDPRFHDLLTRGLVNDGFPEMIAALLGRWLNDTPVRSYQECVRLVSQKKADLPADQAATVSRVIDVLDRLVTVNSTCYLRDTPEKSRVTQWPNNPNVKISAPDHYVDIFEDHFFRHPHRFITRQTPIGSAGSCFALYIAHQLQLWGYNYVMEEDDLPPTVPLIQLTSTAYRMAPARCGTLFNVPSMRQMVERAFGLWRPEKIISRDGDRILDPFRAVKPTYHDMAGYEADSEAHTAALRRALLKCEVFILTIGLAEAWRFAHSGSYTSSSPWKIEPALLRQKELSVAENVAELERLYEVYQQHRPGIKLIVSISPVPFNKTFSHTKHVVEANCLSKSILRVAAQEFVDRHPGSTVYFPAYETILYGTRNPWEPDMRHVSSEGVARVMALFEQMFLVEQRGLPTTPHPVCAPRVQTWSSRLRTALGRLKTRSREIRAG